MKKPRHQRQYELLAIGSHMAHLLVDARINGLLAPTARCLVESAKFIVECHPSKVSLPLPYPYSYPYFCPYPYP